MSWLHIMIFIPFIFASLYRFYKYLMKVFIQDGCIIPIPFTHLYIFSYHIFLLFLQGNY